MAFVASRFVLDAIPYIVPVTVKSPPTVVPDKFVLPEAVNVVAPTEPVKDEPVMLAFDTRVPISWSILFVCAVTL